MRLSARRVQTERVLQNSQRAAHETLELASAFDAIRGELVNNRVDTEELKLRLKDGIADPLRKIGSQRFPELEKRLRELEKRLSNEAVGPPARAAAQAQADAILVEMQQVLDRMLELETFNEALDLLRAIISSQEKVGDETKQRQKDKFRDLIED